MLLCKKLRQQRILTVRFRRPREGGDPFTTGNSVDLRLREDDEHSAKPQE